MKTKLDERQAQEAAKIGTICFYAMYAVCAVSIPVQLITTGNLENVIGETAALLVGGIIFLFGYIRKGLSSAAPRTFIRSLLESMGFSAVFTVLYALALRRKAGAEADITTAVLLFFAGITVLTFLALKLTNFMTECRRRQQEQKYSDEE